MNILTPRKALNKAFLKQKINRREMGRFKTNLQKMLSDMNPDESEEYHKNLLNTSLNDTWYKGQHFINTRERTDLVIHNDKKPEFFWGNPGPQDDIIRNRKIGMAILEPNTHPFPVCFVGCIRGHAQSYTRYPDH
jgi:hypothetical protein